MEPLEFFNEVIIRKPVDEVFKFIINVDAMNLWLRPSRPPASWFPFHAKQATPEEFGLGTLFWVDRMGLRVSRFERNQTWETHSFYFRFPASMIFERTHAKLRFEPVEAGTRFTFNRFMTLKPRMKPFLNGWRKLTQKEGQTAIEKLRDLIEASSSPS